MAAPSIVQSTNFDAGAPAVSFSAPPTVGNTICLLITNTGTSTAPSATDNATGGSNTYTVQAAALDSNDNNQAIIITAPVSRTTTGTFAITLSHAGAVQGHEITGSSGIDGTPGAVKSYPATATALSVPMGTLAQALDLLLAVFQPNNAQNFTAGMNWATLNNQHAEYYYSESETTSTALGSYNATATMASADVWCGAAIAFYAAGAGGTVYTMAINETLAIIDQLTDFFSRLRSINETLAIADALADWLMRNRLVNEGIIVIDQLADFARRQRLINEVITVIDQLTGTYIPAGSQTYTRSIGETMAIVDQLFRIMLANRKQSEVTTIIDLLADSIQRNRATPEVLVINDTLSALAQRNRGISDPISINDSVLRTALYQRLLSEGLTVTDALAALHGGINIKNMVEAIAVNDILASRLWYTRLQQEATSIADQLAESTLRSRGISEGLTVADFIAQTRIRGVTLMETMSIVDALTKYARRVASIAEALTIVDSDVKQLHRTVAIAELISIVENVLGLYIPYINVGTLTNVIIQLQVADDAVTLGFSLDAMPFLAVADDPVTLGSYN